MKKIVKFLSLAMFFALPLAACTPTAAGSNEEKPGDNTQTGGQETTGGDQGTTGGDQGTTGGGQETGEGTSTETTITTLSEAKRIAALMYNINESDVVVSTDESAEADVLEVTESGIKYYCTGFYDEISYAEAKADSLTYLPQGAVLDTVHSLGEDVTSEYGMVLKEFQAFYTKDSVGYDIYVSYFDFDGESDSEVYINIFPASSIEDYAELFYGDLEIEQTSTSTTPEEVASEIAYNVFDDETKYYEETDYFYIRVYWEKAGTITLEQACEEAYEYTPEEFVKATEISEEEDEYGEYDIMYVSNEEETIYIEIQSYLEDGYVCVDFYIYEAE